MTDLVVDTPADPEFLKQFARATLRHITPMGFEHINFNGVLIFPLDRFRNRLMPSNTPSVRRLQRQDDCIATLKTGLLTSNARGGPKGVQFAPF